MQHALSLPPFGELSDPRVVVELAVAAEQHNWDGVFVWDHLLRPVDQATHVADPWITMAAIASATETVRIGPMVTPIARRRPLKLAREIATLDLLSAGRLILGLGLGVDSGGELTRTGEELDPKVRGAMLDEGVQLLDRLLRGEHVVHSGAHDMVDGITLQPTGAQLPRVPFWLATRGDNLAPVRRAARYEGLCPTTITPDRFEQLVEFVHDERGTLDGYDFAIMVSPDHSLDEFDKRGATWAIHEMKPHHSVANILSVISNELG